MPKPPLKQELADDPHDLRPAFSRPGFVTFKVASTIDKPQTFQLISTFARTWGFCLGKVEGELMKGLAEQVWLSDSVRAFLEAEVITDLHVWQRDSAVPGEKGFSPGPNCLVAEVESVLRNCAPDEHLKKMPTTPRMPSYRNRWVLDVVVVEPNSWWLGCHYASRRHECWPGGVIPLEYSLDSVSRANLKMQEALQWSALPMARGDVCVELGSAPGGASQALLDAGMVVLGVDPAEMDERVLGHPNFEHIRRRTQDIPFKRLKGVRWLIADMNVAPNYTLDAVEEIVSRTELSVRGMILTLKLADWRLADFLGQYVERVKGWGYLDVRVRQLVHNRQEVCLVALKSRSQRRVKRKSRRQLRIDSAHASEHDSPHF